MKKIFIPSILVFLLVLSGCKKDKDFLDIPPIQVVPTDVAFSDPALVLSILGDLYNREVDFSSLDATRNDPLDQNTETPGWRTFVDFGEAFPSENGSYFVVQNRSWAYNSWWTWDYAYVRDLNLFIQRDSFATKLSEGDRTRFMAEARFLRASYYFALVKRMGGVPLILRPLEYDNKGNVSALQFPRAKESEVYDFIISEMDKIKDSLPQEATIKSRATKGAALAVKCRAALYAASIAKYGASTPSVSLPGGEVGIPASRANEYYQIAFESARDIITGKAGAYSLYKFSPSLSDNFAAIFTDKSVGNTESIYVEDFKAGAGKTHGYTTNDQPYSFSDEGGDAGRINPSLNLVEAFEKLDNSYAPIETTNGSNPVYYNSPLDAFADRDARLAGTVILPGSRFKAQQVDIWAGYQLADGSIVTSDEAGHLKTLPGGSGDVQVVGKDGPVNGLEYRSQTGFYVRKWLDPTVGSGRRGRGSDVPFIRYRYAEVLLNAAEAAWELDKKDTAALFMNQVRERAGLIIPLTPGEITFDRIVHERRVELAFEGHLLFDMKRWRIADKVWDGVPMSKTDLLTNIGKATKRNTQPWGLWPYKIYNPGNANDGKWIFKETLPAVVTGFDYFRLGNYYTAINDNILAANPKLVRQPNQ